MRLHYGCVHGVQERREYSMSAASTAASASPERINVSAITELFTFSSSFPLMPCLPFHRTVCTVRYRSARHQAFLFVIFQPASGISCIGKENLVIKKIFSIWKLSVICLLLCIIPSFLSQIPECSLLTPV